MLLLLLLLLVVVVVVWWWSAGATRARGDLIHQRPRPPHGCSPPTTHTHPTRTPHAQEQNRLALLLRGHVAEVLDDEEVLRLVRGPRRHRHDGAVQPDVHHGRAGVHVGQRRRRRRRRAASCGSPSAAPPAPRPGEHAGALQPADRCREVAARGLASKKPAVNMKTP